MSDDDDVVRAYRAELVAAGDLDPKDLDELEDHLRLLIEEMRAAGVPDPIGAARHQLGEPTQVAREHARVRPGFATRLGGARLWSAVVMVAVITALNGLATYKTHSFEFGALFAFRVVLLAALIAGRTWARPLLLGTFACSTLLSLSSWIVLDHGTMYLPFNIGALVFLAPWRRRELSVAGVALALQGWLFWSATFAVLAATQHSRWIEHPSVSAASLALCACVAAICGGVLRARWSVIATAIAAIALVATRTDDVILSWMRASGIVSAIASAALAAGLLWRARPRRARVVT